MGVEAVTLSVGLVDFLKAAPLVEEANTLAAWLCFRRSAEQLRVSHFLAYPGALQRGPAARAWRL